MLNPAKTVLQIVGRVTWENDVSGFCRCPGEKLHTKPTHPRDCRINIDGVPTVFCFHTSCLEAVAAANKQLRRELGAGEWEITLPGGRVLRSGGGGGRRGDAGTRGRGEGEARGAAEERLVLERVRALAERSKRQIFEAFGWPYADMLDDSPVRTWEMDEAAQFRAWLRIWPQDSTIWIGGVCDSGRPEHATHFRTVAEWERIGPGVGNFTCGSAFRPGSYSRCNGSCAGTRFLVVESDVLGKDEVGAVFAYLRCRLRYRLHCIVDTAGKSLHGWFDAPANGLLENRLKAGLTVLGCDPRMFTCSQPVRVPGAWRDGRPQTVVWLRG